MTPDQDEQAAAAAMKAGEYDKAVSLLIPLAEQGSEYALLALGWVYETGAAGPPDMEAARSHYQRAADNGSPPAYFELGCLLMAVNEEAQARSAFEAGAGLGNVPCMSRLGRMMVEGCGGPADPATGVEWLQTAAASGHLFARRTLLALEMRSANSAFKRFAVSLRIASLALKAAREHWKNPWADTVRA